MSRVKPAIGQRRRCRRGVLPIASHYVWAADENFADRGPSSSDQHHRGNLVTEQRPTDRFHQLRPPRQISRQPLCPQIATDRRLGEPVEHADAWADEVGARSNTDGDARAADMNRFQHREPRVTGAQVIKTADQLRGHHRRAGGPVRATSPTKSSASKRPPRTIRAPPSRKSA